MKKVLETIQSTPDKILGNRLRITSNVRIRNSLGKQNYLSSVKLIGIFETLATASSWDQMLAQYNHKMLD